VQDTQGRTALVTGAARGIGLATAERFLEDGWRVALLDIDGANLQATVSRLAQPETTLAITADVSDPAQVKAAVQQVVDRFGRLDALVNNAGIAIFKPLLGGAVVNITSISGLRASTLRVAYGTSKAGLAQLTKQQAIELAQHGIRVNAVAPGPVDTAMAQAVHSPEIRAAYHDAVPLARYGLESELANVIVFLCSERAGYVTGQVVAVDGGFEATGIGLPALRGGGR